MPIPLFLLDRIKGSAMSGPQVANAFTKLAQVVDQAESGDCAIIIEYVAWTVGLGGVLLSRFGRRRPEPPTVPFGAPPPVRESAGPPPAPPVPGL